MRHGNLWASSVLHGCVVGTKCVSECTLYRPMVIQPLLHRAGPRTDCRTARRQSFQPPIFTQHSPQRACHSGTVLRTSLLSDCDIQRYCQWYGCSTAYFEKDDEGWKFKQVSEKVCMETLFQFGAQRRAGHRDGLRHRNSVTESIENTLTRDFSLCWRLSLC